MENVHQQLMDGEPVEHLCQSDIVEKKQTS